MIVVKDDLWLCEDCLMFACNGDISGISGEEAERRAKEVEEGVASLGAHLVPDFDSNTGEGIDEFSWRACDACGSMLDGSRHRFAVLGPDPKALARRYFGAPWEERLAPARYGSPGAFDRYDILAAYNVYSMLWGWTSYEHGIQNRLHRIGYAPASSDQQIETLSQNAKEIFGALCKRRHAHSIAYERWHKRHPDVFPAWPGTKNVGSHASYLESIGIDPVCLEVWS